MAPSDSFDPRTWQGEGPAPVTVTAAARESAPAPPPPGGSPKRWLGLALSAAILAGGALAAYATRADAVAVAAASPAR